MPTPQQKFRRDTETWEAFKAACPDGNRSAIINAYIDWHLRRPGARLPTRPPADPS